MTEQHSQAKLDSILKKVQALLANADDPANPPEAQETYRAKAEALMFQYRISETQAASAAVGTAASGGLRPVWRTVFICRVGGEFQQTYRYMAAQALNHVDAKAVTDIESNPDDDNRNWWVAKAVGYESDLRYAEVLYTSMHLGFAGKMEPKVNPALSDQENAYILRSAGLEGRRIAKLLWGDDSKPNRAKARKLFARHAEQLGEDPSVLLGRGNSVAVYRESYAEGFETEMWSRLNRMRISRGDSGELVLKSRKDAVLEAFYERYPRLRPRPTAPASRSIGGRDTCEKCRKAKSGYCRDHQYLRPRAVSYRPRSYSSAGYSRGKTAARSVDLGSTGRGRVSGGSQRSLEG